MTGFVTVMHALKFLFQ